MPLSLQWVYFIRRFQRQQGNGELKLGHLQKLGLLIHSIKHY